MLGSPSQSNPARLRAHQVCHPLKRRQESLPRRKQNKAKRKSKHVDEPAFNVESDDDSVFDIDDDKADADKQVDDDFAVFGSLMSSAPPALKW